VITLNLPGGDPTLRVHGYSVDAGARFVREVVDTALTVQADADLPPAARLMLTAGADALDDSRPTPHRLRGLGAVLVALQRPGHGVRMRLDDLELASGSTEHSADAALAAAAPAPYSHALRAACAECAGEPVRLVVDRDQQLPAAITAAELLQENKIELTGRFATARWPVLRTLSAFTRAGLAATPCGVEWTVADAFCAGALAVGPRWRERSGDPVPDGAWAGRVGLAELGDPDRLGDVRVAVLGLCADPRMAVGRGGTELAWPALARAVDALRVRGVSVLVELWLGAPGIGLDQAERAVATVRGIVDRIAGLRVFDWPVGWTDPTWRSRQVRLAPVHADLARHHQVSAPVPPDGPALAAAVTAIGKPLARTGELVPGRVAGAYLCPPAQPTAAGLDPDVVLGGPRVAVNLRTGAVTKVTKAVSDLVRRRAGDAEVEAALAAMADDDVRALRDRAVLGACAGSPTVSQVAP
jgi:hypothetical protein